MKQRRLLSTPIPHVDESPASILIRAAEGNRYENVHQMVSVTKLNIKQAYLDLLINYLDRFLQLATALYLNCVAPEEVLERKGPTTRALRRFLLHFFPTSFFRQDGTAFCPGCLHEKPYLRKIWMFKPYATCHLHNLPIQTQCPHCKAEMKISRGAICVCSQCGCDITQKPEQTPNLVATWVKSFVGEHDQRTEEFTRIFSWAKTIVGIDGSPKDDDAATNLAYQYFNNHEEFPKHIVNFMSYDSRHPKLKCLSLIASDSPLSKLAADILNNHFREIPFSKDDLDCHISLTEVGVFLEVSPTTVAKLLNRNNARPVDREAQISVREVLTILDTDDRRKADIKTQTVDHLLTINDVAESLKVHPEIVRSIQKAGYLQFERHTVAGSLKYMAPQKQLDVFCSRYMMIGTLAKNLGVNSTDLTAKLAVLDIQPIATPKNSSLKTCIFNAHDVCNLTRDTILKIEKPPTNAGRKLKGTVIAEAPKNDQILSTIEASKRLDVSIQQVKTLIQRNILERVLDSRTGVYVTRNSVKNLVRYLKNSNYISIDVAVNELKTNKTLLKREWISTGLVEHKDLVYWELVKAADIQKVKGIKSEYVSASEAGEILGMHRTHANNLHKRGLIKRHYFDKENKIPLYKRADILLLKSA